MAFDPAQDIYHRKRIWWDAEINLKGGGSAKSKILKIGYRNTNQILQLAVRFKGLENYVKETTGESEEPVVPVSNNIQGEIPQIRLFDNTASVLNEITDEITSLIRTNNFNLKDIAIISTSPVINKFIKGNPYLLGKQFENFIKNTDTINLLPAKNTVKILTAHSSKGLEWKVVYLLGVDDMGFKYKLSDSILIYIGITRARELLRIFYIKENEFINKLLDLNKSV